MKGKIKTEAPKPGEAQETAIQFANKKAAELTLKYKDQGVFEVVPIVFREEGTNEDIIGFFKEPSRSAKMAVLDKSALGGFSVVEEILPSVFLPDESDFRFMSEDQTYDAIHLGFVMAVYDRIKYKTNSAKKK